MNIDAACRPGEEFIGLGWAGLGCVIHDSRGNCSFEQQVTRSDEGIKLGSRGVEFEGGINMDQNLA